LPLASNSFDLVYSRFLLEYLSERQTAVQEMVRVCRSGGKVLLQDLDGQLVWHDPIDRGLQARLAKVVKLLGKTGFDPLVGRKLFGIARAAGLRDISVRVEPYHLIVGCVDPENLRLWELKLDIALPMMAKALGSQKRAAQLKADLLDYFRKEETLSYSVMFTIVGSKPLGGGHS
jgi:SAM-dependent methyltransferase